MRLLMFESKRVLRSLMFWVVLAALLSSIHSQMNHEMLSPPRLEDKHHGTKTVAEPAVIYPNIMMDLIQDTENNHFVSYPFGFYRTKQLKQPELELMQDLIAQISGQAYYKLIQLSPEEQMAWFKQSVPSEVELDLFRRKISSLIGPGTSYSKNELFGQTPRNHQEALREYHAIAESGYTISLARLFSDYAGIFVSLFAWFVPLTLWYHDRRVAIRETLFTKQVSTCWLVWARLIASIWPLMFGVLCLLGYYLFRWSSHYGWDQVALIQPLRLVFVWLLPIILLMSAGSTLLTILTDSPLAAPAGVLMWYLLNMGSSGPIGGNYGWKLIPRHNSLSNEFYYRENVQQLLINRSLWLIVALILAIITIALLNRKRSGAYGKHVVSSH